MNTQNQQEPKGRTRGYFDHQFDRPPENNCSKTLTGIGGCCNQVSLLSQLSRLRNQCARPINNHHNYETAKNSLLHFLLHNVRMRTKFC